MTTNRVRSHVRVQRNDGRQFSSGNVAYRELLGTPQELSGSECVRMRPIIRNGGTFIDRHGFIWSSVGGTVAEESIAWTDFTFGVELELVAPIDRYQISSKLIAAGFTNWTVMHDGSLTSDIGWYASEVVSPILKGEEGLATLKAVMDFLRLTIGARVNASCGMHVHIGVRGMKPTRLRKIAIAFINNEKNFDSLVPASRLTNRYCQSNARIVRHSRLTTAETVAQIGEAMNGGNSSQHYNHYRYYKLNFQSFVRHGTVEFRQHAGTVESSKACAWVRLIAGFCAGAASAPQQATGVAQTFDAFIAGALTGDDADDVGTYLVGRRAKFAAQR